MEKIRRGVFIHSYNVSEKNWYSTVWGEAPNKPGRLPAGVNILFESGADQLFLIGSAIGKDNKSSGEWMRDLLMEKIKELPQFSIYPVLSRFSEAEIMAELSAKLVFVPAPEVKNTVDEIIFLDPLCYEYKIDVPILVSSFDHMSRILRDAGAIWQEQNSNPKLAAHLLCRPAVTLYTKEDGITPPHLAKMASVIIAEPRAPLVSYFKRMFGISNNPEALAEIDAVLKKYGK